MRFDHDCSGKSLFRAVNTPFSCVLACYFLIFTAFSVFPVRGGVASCAAFSFFGVNFITFLGFWRIFCEFSAAFLQKRVYSGRVQLGGALFLPDLF